MKKIVIIGGGTGTSTLLTGLRGRPVRAGVIVSTSDDGGSTGRLRRQHGSMPAGDIRQVLSGLASSKELSELFSYRFEEGELKGHAVGNIILTALERSLGNIELAISQYRQLLGAKGEVVPVTLFPTQLAAILENGKKIMGEHNIDEPKDSGNLHIKSLQLSPKTPANPQALALIKTADMIVFGPGDLYTSILPNLLVKGVPAILAKSKALKVLVNNLMTKYGQTAGFMAPDFLMEVNRYLQSGGKFKSKIDVMIVNDKSPSRQWLNRYRSERAEMVEPDIKKLKEMGVRVIAAPLLSSNTFKKISADVLHRSFLRHDSERLGKIIFDLAKKRF